MTRQKKIKLKCVTLGISNLIGLSLLFGQSPKQNKIIPCTCGISYSNITVNKRLEIKNIKGILSLDSIQSMDDSLQISIDSSSLTLIEKFRVLTKFADVTFSNDSLLDNTIFYNWGRLDTKMNVTFHDCYINTMFAVNEPTNNISITFDNCEFGPKTFFLLTIKAIAFKNCHRFSKPIYLGFSQNSTTTLDFEQSDLNNINFSFTSHMGITQDYWNNDGFNLYDELLAKFEREGKSSSYKNLMIQYKQFKYSNLYFGDVYNFFDKYWWNYGFSKLRIIAWTCLFLIIFFIGNVFARKTINNYYTILPKGQVGYYYITQKRFRYYFNFLIRIFFFTVFIFFTFKLNIERLSIQTTRFMAWIFLQYFIGLVCLFFLFNAVLKL